VEFMDLCAYTCARGYCPPDACVTSTIACCVNTGTDANGIPIITCRPSSIPETSMHGSQFSWFDDRAKAYGFEEGSPAVQAAPVFLYSRIGINYVGPFIFS
jgi:hypothetical protein